MKIHTFLIIIVSILAVAYIVSLVLDSPYTKEIVDLLKMVVIAIIGYYLGYKEKLRSIAVSPLHSNDKSYIACIGLLVAVGTAISYASLSTIITSILLAILSIALLFK